MRKPKHLEEEGYRAPQVTGDMKLKLYRVTPGEKRKQRVKDRKCEGQAEERSSVGEVAQDLEGERSFVLGRRITHLTLVLCQYLHFQNKK